MLAMVLTWNINNKCQKLTSILERHARNDGTAVVLPCTCHEIRCLQRRPAQHINHESSIPSDLLSGCEIKKIWKLPIAEVQNVEDFVHKSVNELSPRVLGDAHNTAVSIHVGLLGGYRNIYQKISRAMRYNVPSSIPSYCSFMLAVNMRVENQYQNK